MNLGGIKVGSVELEQAVMEGLGEGRVVEVAAVGVPSGGGGGVGGGGGGGPEKLVLFLVLKKRGGWDGEKMDKLLMECRKVVAGRLNPLFRVEKVVLMKTLPRTSSGKVMRRTLREQQIGMSRGGSRSRM
jgi:acyl-coenzyme A synthetase/AMP-(fatty) acid ligase